MSIVRKNLTLILFYICLYYSRENKKQCYLACWLAHLLWLNGAVGNVLGNAFFFFYQQLCNLTPRNAHDRKLIYHPSASYIVVWCILNYFFSRDFSWIFLDRIISLACSAWFFFLNFHKSYQKDSSIPLKPMIQMSSIKLNNREVNCFDIKNKPLWRVNFKLESLNWTWQENFCELPRVDYA